MHYWLMKSEPDVFSIADLARAGTAPWDGVRNYQARNHMQQMQPGDLFLFYHSSCSPPGLAGIGRIVTAAYPDRTALDANSPYYDPKSSEAKLPWVAVDVAYEETFGQLVSLDTLRALPGLGDIALLKRGSRLSVMPVTASEWEVMVLAAREE